MKRFKIKMDDAMIMVKVIIDGVLETAYNDTVRDLEKGILGRLEIELKNGEEIHYTINNKSLNVEEFIKFCMVIVLNTFKINPNRKTYEIILNMVKKLNDYFSDIILNSEDAEAVLKTLPYCSILEKVDNEFIKEPKIIVYAIDENDIDEATIDLFRTIFDVLDYTITRTEGAYVLSKIKTFRHRSRRIRHL